MANTYKILGQSAPNAATSTTLYTCPASTQTIVSVITATNRSATGTSIRVSIDPDAAGDSNPDYIAFDLPIAGNQTIELGRGVVCDASDLIRVYNTLATVSFSAFGVEIT
jgi:hypothetical protein